VKGNDDVGRLVLYKGWVNTRTQTHMRWHRTMRPSFGALPANCQPSRERCQE
jgi:hypothetical protein